MGQKLRAMVRQATGNTKHTLGILGPNRPEVESELPNALTVVIEANDEGILLLRFDKCGEFCGDTWHQSIDEAMEQAHFKFGISTSDWSKDAAISSDKSH